VLAPPVKTKEVLPSQQRAESSKGLLVTAYDDTEEEVVNEPTLVQAIPTEVIEPSPLASFVSAYTEDDEKEMVPTKEVRATQSLYQESELDEKEEEFIKKLSDSIDS